jgi:hypothetical protein
MNLIGTPDNGKLANGRVLTQGFFHCGDGLFKSAKLTKGRPDPNQRLVKPRSIGLKRMARSKLRSASSGSTATLWT